MTDLTSLVEAPSDTAMRWAPVFKSLGDPTRLEITLLLAEKPRTVRELQDVLGLQQAIVSHHLKTLREQGVVIARPEGRSNVYLIQIGPLACLAQCLAAMMTSAGECACPVSPE